MNVSNIFLIFYFLNKKGKDGDIMGELMFS